MIKVCHVTSVHPREDVRIFKKQCLSLVNAGYDVYLVQQGKDCEKNGVHIVGFGEIALNRLKRMLFTTRQAYKKALEINADIYHLHDPELLLYALKLKRRGKKVIFDSHEDVSADILEKSWIPSFLRKMVSRIYSAYEKYYFSKIDGVIGVTPSLCDRLKKISKRMVMVTNYPIWVEDQPIPKFESRKIVFPGLINPQWSIDRIINAIEDIDVVLELRSRNIDKDFLSKLKELPAWKKVNYPGAVPHKEVLKLLSECMCGLALLKPSPNSGGKMGTLGNTKLFEYMMAGIPVVCTDFTLWKQIIDEWECGICVDVEDIQEIRYAISEVLSDPQKARRMGQNGRRAIKERFNWNEEEKKLLLLYEEISKLEVLDECKS